MAQPINKGRSINQEKQPEVAQKRPVKKSYVTPSLVEYGSVAKLTQSGGFTTTDISGAAMMPCL